MAEYCRLRVYWTRDSSSYFRLIEARVENIVRAICQKEGIGSQNIQVMSGGQVNQVFLVDGAHVVRIGAREDAHQRLKHESELLTSLAGKVPVAKIEAFGLLDGYAYQIQQFMPGQKLYSVWKNLRADVQESIAAEIAASLKVIHAIHAPYFGSGHEDTPHFDTWGAYLKAKFDRTLSEIRALHIQMEPGFLEMAESFFEEHQAALDAGSPVLIHGDLSLMNILVHNSKVSALIDFEYALQAPPDYELWVMEAFSLYPNDYAEDDQERFCTADFANFIPLLRKHYPALFETPRLRERMDLYQVDAALGSYLAWRKDNLNTLPPDRMAAKMFYMARITNFLFRNGARMFHR